MSFDLKIKNGKLVLNTDGSVQIVSDNAKLRQDIIKILLTKLGENKYHAEYGSEIGALQIGSVPDQNLLESDLSSSAELSIRKLISLQKTQMKKQYLTPGEIIVDILNIQVLRDTADPRLYNIFISVLTQKLDVINESITIRII